MRAYISSREEEESPDLDSYEIVFDTGERWCVITHGDGPPGYQRIPLSTGIKIASRDGVSWVEPDTATQGRKLVKKMRDDLINILSSERTYKPIPVEENMDNGYVTSLMDVSRHRDNKRERMERYRI